MKKLLPNRFTSTSLKLHSPKIPHCLFSTSFISNLEKTQYGNNFRLLRMVSFHKNETNWHRSMLYLSRHNKISNRTSSGIFLLDEFRIKCKSYLFVGIVRSIRRFLLEWSFPILDLKLFDHIFWHVISSFGWKFSFWNQLRSSNT